jgi:membrane protein YqaA with SNARE-associated domain
MDLWALLVSSFLAATVLPLASEVPLAVVVRRHGDVLLVLSWVPIVGDAIVALAGAARVPFATFSLWTILGKALRYAAVAWIALNV